MIYIRKHSTLLALLTLLAYFFIAQTSIQTKHTHFYPNGVVITHSHPMHSNGEGNGEPATKHHHSKSEICFFNNLQFHSYNISDPISIEVASREICLHYYVGNDSIKYGSDYLKIDPRGPPLG